MMKLKYLALFHSNEKYDIIFDRIRYLIIILLRSNISYVVSHKYAKIKIDSNGNLLLKKTITMHNVIILIKSVFNENHNHY